MDAKLNQFVRQIWLQYFNDYLRERHLSPRMNGEKCGG